MGHPVGFPSGKGRGEAFEALFDDLTCSGALPFFVGDGTLDLLQVRLFELLSVGLFLLFLFLIRHKLNGNPHYYANLLACGSAFLWEWYMDIGPLQLGYSKEFVNLWVIDGVGLPLMIPFAYGWYWFLPNLIFLPNRDWMDGHWKKMQYLYIFLIASFWNFIVEWPATTFTDLWHYYWKAWTIGGIPITNPFNAGAASLLIYAFSRIAMKQEQTGPLGLLYLHHLAWVNLAFYVTWVFFTYILGITMPFWHMKG